MAENDLGQSYGAVLQDRVLTAGESGYQAWLQGQQQKAASQPGQTPSGATGAPQTSTPAQATAPATTPVIGQAELSASPSPASGQTATASSPEQPAPPSPDGQIPAMPAADATSPPASAQPWPVPAQTPAAWPQPKTDKSFADTLWAGLKDVAYGTVVEGPAQFVIGGRQEFVNHLGSTINDLSDWLNKNLPSAMVDQGTVDQQKAFRDSLKLSGIHIVGEPTTTTGHVIRSLSEFMTGFTPMMKAFQAGGVGKVVSSIASGGLTMGITADPNKDNLTAVMGKMFPSMVGPIADYMGTDPNDSAMGNRLKNAFEGMFIGAGIEGATKLAEGVYKAVKVYRAAGDAAQQAAQVGSQAASAAPTAAQREATAATQFVDAAHGGIPRDAPLVEVVSPAKEAAKTLASAGAASEPGVPGQVLGKGIMEAQRGTTFADPSIKDLGFKFNWRNFSGDDIDTAAQMMMKEMAPRLKAAGRDTITHDATSQLADDLGLTVEKLLAWQKGTAQPAEYLVAGSRLMRASRDELLRLARVAEMPTSSAADGYALRHQFMIHSAISEKFVGAVSEAGRALNAMKLAYQGGDVQYAKAIQDFMAIGGGDKTARDLASSLIDLDRAGVGAGGLIAAAKRGWFSTSIDMVKEGFTAGLLWRPTTHIRNIFSNTITQAQQAYEREMAAGIGVLSGTENGVKPGEGAIMLYGQLSALKDAFRTAAASIRQEGGYALEHGVTPTSKIDMPRQAISAARVAIERGAQTPADIAAFTQTGVGKAIDYVGNAITTPFRILSAADDFFKVTGFSGEINAQALRQGLREGLSGKPLYDRVAEIVADPPKDIKMAAEAAAKYVTFQSELGPTGRNFMALRNQSNIPLWYVFPFVKTPANILTYGFQRTPIAFLMKGVQDDIAAGGAARDIALARVASGAALMSVFFDWASSGIITGQGPNSKGEQNAWRRTGWQPWAFRGPDGKYYSYNGSDPAAMPMAFAASMAEMVRRSEIDPDTADTLAEWAAHGVGAMSVSILNKSWLQGMSQLVGTVENAARGTGGFEDYLHRAFGSFMPFSSALGTAKRATDPTIREVNSFWDSWQAQLPILSKNLKPRRDLWGREIKPQEVFGRAYDVAVPWTASAPTNSPIDYEMARNGIAVSDIGRHASILGVDMNFKDYPEVKDYYERLAGNEMPNLATGKGTMDTLNDMVTGKGPYATEWQMGSEGPSGGKSQLVKRIINQARSAAQQQLHAEMPTRFPEFYAKWNQKRIENTAMKQPNDIKFSMPDMPSVPLHNPLPSPDWQKSQGFKVPN